MLTKKRILKASYYAPVVVALIRTVLTIWFLVANPLDLPLRFFQLIPIGVYVVTVFSHLKLYSDGVPVISLILPTLLHAVIIYVFKRVVVIVPFAVLLFVDILYLVVKSVKASMFPFDIEGDDEDEDLADVEEILNDAE